MGAPGSSLAASLIALADTLEADFELVRYLDGLLAGALRLVDGDAGSVMLTGGDGPGELRLLTSIGDGAADVGLFDLQCHDGPGVDCLAQPGPVIVDDIPGTSGWPRFGDMAGKVGYRSAASFPLRLRSETVGALSVLWRAPFAAASEDIHAVQALADMATIGILQDRERQEARELSDQLQSALRTRIIIEQAKGVLAEQAALDMGVAFEVLRRYSRNRSRRLREVATEIVNGRLSAADIVGQAARDGARGARAEVRRSNADGDGGLGAVVAAS